VVAVALALVSGLEAQVTHHLQVPVKVIMVAQGVNLEMLVVVVEHRPLGLQAP
jgi:hypothetical protein